MVVELFIVLLIWSIRKKLKKERSPRDSKQRTYCVSVERVTAACDISQSIIQVSGGRARVT